MLFTKPKYTYDILPETIILTSKVYLIHYLFNCFETKIYVSTFMSIAFVNPSRSEKQKKTSHYINDS